VIDHIGLEVRDYLRSKEFYVAAVAPLGIELLLEFEGRIGGFGRDGKPFFWLRQGDPAAGIHVAFAAPDTDTVDAFYAAAIRRRRRGQRPARPAQALPPRLLRCVRPRPRR
jgi:catechol 2,3-dioxygenase-like lactoylglutathione lyase family enzyme